MKMQVWIDNSDASLHACDMDMNSILGGLIGGGIAVLVLGGLVALQPWAKFLWEVGQKRKEWEEAKEKAQSAKADAEAAQKRAEDFARELVDKELAGIRQLHSENREHSQRNIDSAARENRIRSVLFDLKSVQVPGLHTLKASGAANLPFHDEFVEVLERQEASGMVSVVQECPWLKNTPNAREILKRLKTLPAMPEYDFQKLQALRRELAPETLENEPEPSA